MINACRSKLLVVVAVVLDVDVTDVVDDVDTIDVVTVADVVVDTVLLVDELPDEID
jgi:hypothetical protein